MKSIRWLEDKQERDTLADRGSLILLWAFTGLLILAITGFIMRDLHSW